jgi:hypothetical protein
MSELTLKNPLVSRQIAQLNDEPVHSVEGDVDSATPQNRIPLTVRSRHKVLRMAPAIDNGFRPFRVF